MELAMISRDAAAILHVSPIKPIELHKVWKVDPDAIKVREYITPRHEHIWKCVTQIAASAGMEEETEG